MIEVLAPEKKTLTVSCVSFNSDSETLHKTIASLAKSCQFALSKNLLDRVALYLIDNGPDAENLALLKEMKSQYQDAFQEIILKTGHGNVGYGRGHNISINESSSQFHLILNPDVILDKSNISEAIAYMALNPSVGLLAPDAFNEAGEREYIAKRTPSVLVLAMRALKIQPASSILRKMIDQYEYRDLIPCSMPVEIFLASGCYMFFRGEVLRKLNGFDPSYFMYFEDFDISQRATSCGKVMHHPEIKIIHSGGGAFSKGVLHQLYFLHSYLKFVKILKK